MSTVPRSYPAQGTYSADSTAVERQQIQQQPIVRVNDKRMFKHKYRKGTLNTVITILQLLVFCTQFLVFYHLVHDPDVEGNGSSDPGLAIFSIIIIFLELLVLLYKRRVFKRYSRNWMFAMVIIMIAINLVLAGLIAGMSHIAVNSTRGFMVYPAIVFTFLAHVTQAILIWIQKKNRANAPPPLQKPATVPYSPATVTHPPSTVFYTSYQPSTVPATVPYPSYQPTTVDYPPVTVTHLPSTVTDHPCQPSPAQNYAEVDTEKEKMEMKTEKEMEKIEENVQNEEGEKLPKSKETSHDLWKCEENMNDSPIDTN